MIWNWLKNKTNPGAIKPENEAFNLAEELEQAKQEWAHAQSQLDHAVGKEQIDYAIFALEAAEKRYEMLLKEMKHTYRERTTNAPVHHASQNGETL